MEEDKSNQKFRIKFNPDVTKYRITIDNAYKVYIRQKQFESLVDTFLCTAEPKQILKDQIKRDMEVRPAGFVIQPNLFWLVAILSGLISDKIFQSNLGLFSSSLLQRNEISARLFYYKIPHFVWRN